MVTAWRIVHKKYVQSAFDGEGARLYGGRWNTKGQRVVYTSGSASLAALEMIAGLNAMSMLLPYAYIPVEIPERCIRDIGDLPEGWNEIPPSAASQDVAQAWIQDGVSVALSVPSVIIPIEKNYLINPLHPDFGKLRIGKPIQFRFDPRLIQLQMGKK